MRPIRHWIIATILIAALAVSACGDDDKPPTPTAPTPTTPATTTPTSPTLNDLSLLAPSWFVDNPEIQVGQTVELALQAEYSDGSTQDVTQEATWSSSNDNVGTVVNGVITGQNPGTAQASASYSSRSISTEFRVVQMEDPTPTSLEIDGPNSLEVGETVQYQATITYSDDATKRVADGIEWVSGNTTVATVDSDGRVTGRRAGGFDLRATAEGVTGRKTGIRVEPPPGPATSFGAGTWIVNEDIAPGRYYTNPRSGCYWERLSGLGGTSADRITNEFIGFNSGQEIVDIASSDRAFKPDADCGRWDMSPEPGPSSGTITPGRWLVGRQIQPGDYETNASPGCYWERLRGFSGESRDRITNDFVGDGGRVIVSIRSSDAGFYADDDCGRWSRRDGSSSNLVSPGAADPFRIEQNYRRHRAEMGR